MKKSHSFVMALVVVVVAAASSFGCAPMSVGPAVVTDVPLSTGRQSNLTGARQGAIAQEGTRVSARLVEMCDVKQVDTIQRTSIREHKNDAPQNEWWAAIGGTVFVGAGALAVANPGTLQPKDKDVSEKEVRGAGYAMLATGAVLLAVPIIDYFRVHRVAEHEVERVDVMGPTLQRNVPCAAAPRGTEVFARYPDGRNVRLGSTDAMGRLDADLASATPSDWFFPPNARAALFSDRGDLGDVSLTQLFVTREAAAWRAAESSSCATSVDEDACSTHAAYAQNYPSGVHVAEARLALDEASARRRLAAEEAAFAALDLRVCSAVKADRDAIEVACGPLSQYLAEFADGRHVAAVQQASRPAQALYARLDADEEREGGEEVSVVSSGGFIPYAGNGGGPTLCADGMTSHSSGRGTCSHHGGVAGGGAHHSSGRTYRAPASHSSSGGHSSSGHGSSGGSHSMGGHRGGGRRK